MQNDFECFAQNGNGRRPICCTLHVSRQTINAIETGSTTQPALAFGIARLFKQPIEAILSMNPKTNR